MNCHEFHAKLTAFARGELGDAAHEARAHAESCPRCGGALAAQRRLAEDFVALAAGQASEQVTPALQHQLLAAFRAEEQPRPARRMALRLLPALAAALVLCLAGAYGLARYARRAAPAVSSTAQQQRSQEIPRATAIPPVTPKERAEPRLAASRPSGRAPVMDVQLVSEFYAVPYAEPLRPEESKRLVRVRVPQSTLVAFGLPVSPDRGHEPIDADVLVGEDNLPRAIRMVADWRPETPRPVRGRAVNTSFTK